MLDIITTNIPITFWLRILMFFYRIRWKVAPLLRIFGFSFRMSWEELIFATRILLPQIAAFNPDILIGVGIGGTIWSAVLAGSLHDKHFLSVDRTVDRINQMRITRIVNPASIINNSEFITDKVVLLVSAEMISGETTIAAMEIVDSLNPREVKVATIDYFTTSRLMPDYAYAISSKVIQKPWRSLPTYTNPDEPIRE